MLASSHGLSTGLLIKVNNAQTPRNANCWTACSWMCGCAAAVCQKLLDQTRAGQQATGPNPQRGCRSSHRRLQLCPVRWPPKQALLTACVAQVFLLHSSRLLVGDCVQRHSEVSSEKQGQHGTFVWQRGACHPGPRAAGALAARRPQGKRGPLQERPPPMASVTHRPVGLRVGFAITSCALACLATT